MSERETCRLCANMVNVIDSRNLFLPDQQKLLWQIEKFTRLQLKNENNLPKLICSLCQRQAMEANEFRERCIQAQLHFVTEEYKNQCKQETTDEEVVYEITMVKEEIVEEEEGKELFPHDAIMDIKVEPSNSVYSTTSAYDPFPETHYYPDEDMQTNESEEDLFVKEESMLNVNKFKAPRRKQKSHATTALTKNKKKPFNIDKCDQCGVAITCRSHFDIHMRRHNGNKQLTCHFCPSRFVTTSELQSHIRFHTGEKPYCCRYCDHRSRSSSCRARHERSHTNDRPYACKDCERIFSSSSDLKRHGVIHTGERPFICNFCNVSFGFAKHLRQHQRTKIHKLAEANHQKVTNVESVIDLPMSGWKHACN